MDLSAPSQPRPGPTRTKFCTLHSQGSNGTKECRVLQSHSNLVPFTASSLYPPPVGPPIICFHCVQPGNKAPQCPTSSMHFNQRNRQSGGRGKLPCHPLLPTYHADTAVQLFHTSYCYPRYLFFYMFFLLQCLCIRGTSQLSDLVTVHLANGHAIHVCGPLPVALSTPEGASFTIHLHYMSNAGWPFVE